MENVICDLCTGAHLPVECERAAASLAYRPRGGRMPAALDSGLLARLHDAMTGAAPAAHLDVQSPYSADGVVVPILRHRNVAETGGLVRPKRRLA